MIILAFIASAAVTGVLIAVLARTLGVEHMGILIAIGVIAGGIQMLVLMVSYLHHTRETTRRRRTGHAEAAQANISRDF